MVAIQSNQAMRRPYLISLAAASTEEAVVDIARRYLGQWQPAELAAIPASCRPRGVGDAEELADSAFALTRARIDSSNPQPLLEEMEAFFAMACRRVSELEAIPQRLAGKPYLTR